MSKIYLCKPGGVMLGTLTGIDENTASLHQSVGDTWELTFEVGRYQSVNGTMEETTFYQSLKEMMELFVDDIDGKGVYFQIDAEPEISGDGIQETKNVTAHSIECELSTKMLHNFKINCGVQDSQEYLVGKYDANGEFINKNINPVTKLPIDYITVKNTYASRLQNLLDKINNSDTTGWVDNETGLIYFPAEFYNQEKVYPVLKKLFDECPRIYVDVQDNGSYQTYLNVIENKYVAYGYEIFICSSYTTIDDSIYDNYIVQLEALVRNKDKWLDPAEWQAEYDRINNALNEYVQQQYQKDYTITRLKTGLQNLISYYTEYGNQLSLIDLAIENAKTSGWQVGDIPDTVASKKFQFNIESQDILSFLKSDCTKAMKVLFDFDRFNRRVNIIDVENDDEANDTGIFLTYRNLINSVDVKTSSNDGIRTKFLPTGQNNLGITQVNFGENNIINLDWFINQLDEYGNLQYVSPEIADQYKAWQRFRDEDEIDVVIGSDTLHGTRRNLFTELTRMYNTKLKEINDEMNRLPYNDCEIDFKKYTIAELNVAYKAYTNAFDAIQEAYKNEVHAETFDIYTLETTPSTCTKITDTIYWNDFICYRDTILPNVINALKIYVYTDDGAYEELSIYHDGSPFDEYGRPTTPQQWDSKKEEWVCYPGGNPKYNKNAEMVTENESDAYVYDMTLYGPVELQAKINAWIEVAGVQYKKGFVLKQEGSKWVVIDPPPVNFYDYTVPKDGYKFNTADETGWKLLGEEVQNTFTGMDAYINYLNDYLDYTSLDVRQNKVLKKESRGIIPVAWDKLQELNQEIEILERDQEDIQTARQDIAEEVTLENYLKAHDPNYNLTLKTLTTMLREASYNNNNILTTNLDDIVTAIDKQEELYQDAQIALSEKSQPQLSFEIGLDNLYALDEYKNFQDSIELLKYIRISRGLYKDNFVKLRVIGITRNPIIPTEELTLEFSNMTYNNQGASDFAHLFDDLAGGGGGSGSSSGSGSGGGTYGTNDAEITITNNLLNALLRSKSYTQAVGSTLLGQLSTDEGYARVLAQTGLFSQLETGDMLINGKCLVDRIQSRNYSDVEGERAGSKILLNDGTFDLAGGRLVYWIDLSGTGHLDVEGNFKLTSETSYHDSQGDTTLGNVFTEFKLEDGKLLSNIRSAGSIRSWKLPDNSGITIDLYYAGDGTPADLDPENYAASNYNNKYALNQKNGKVYKSNGTQWVLQNIQTTEYQSYVDGTYSTIEQTDSKISTEVGKETTRAKGAEGDIADAMQSWKIPDEYKGHIDIYYFGSGDPTDAGYAAADYNGKIALNQTTGYIYQSNGTVWQDKKHCNSLEMYTYEAYSKIDQTAERITSTVAQTTKNYDTTGWTISIYYYGSGDPTTGDPAYPASDHSGKYALNQSNGYVYYSDGSSWSTPSSTDERPNPCISVQLSTQSQIRQTFDSITLEVTSPDENKDVSIKINGGGTGKQGTINIRGEVTFEALKGNGTTVINGGNITTGVIKDQQNKNSINMTTGDLSLGNGGIAYTANTGTLALNVSSLKISSVNAATTTDVSNVLGTSADPATANTVYGAKKAASDAQSTATTAKSTADTTANHFIYDATGVYITQDSNGNKNKGHNVKITGQSLAFRYNEEEAMTLGTYIKDGVTHGRITIKNGILETAGSLIFNTIPLVGEVIYNENITFYSQSSGIGYHLCCAVKYPNMTYIWIRINAKDSASVTDGQNFVLSGIPYVLSNAFSAVIIPGVVRTSNGSTSNNNKALMLMNTTGALMEGVIFEFMGGIGEGNMCFYTGVFPSTPTRPS